MKTLPWITGLSLITLLLVSCTSNNNVSTAPPSQQAVNPRSQTPQPSTSAPPPNDRLLLPKKLISPTDPTTIKIPTGRPDPFASLAVSLPKSSVSNQRQVDQPQAGKNSGEKSQNPKKLGDKSQNPKKLGETPQTDENLRARLQAERQDRLQSEKNLQAKLQAERRDRLQAEKNIRTKLQAERQDRLQAEKNLRAKLQSERQNKLPAEKTQPAPSTKLARAVRVNGVMQIGGRLVAIVKEPDETSSRSVSMGEYLSKGAVLVKRIELKANKEPRVILEQNGVEVIKSVSSVDGAIASLP